LGQIIGQVIANQLPNIATIDRSMRARKGRVYIDYVQNGHGRLLVSPFSVRPLPKAPVSTPLQWSEVHHGLDQHSLTIANVVERCERRGADPLLAVLEIRPDLQGVLANLLERLERGGR
jgi:bifunctional non-homologous end joining protein LigD